MFPDVAQACTACGAAVVVQAPVCPSCGSPVVPPQRRVVTAMFVDLTGYTKLCADLDHEDVHLLVRPLMNGLRRGVEDLGGMVPSIEGDGFMAVFGGVVSDPDDPMKAVVAAAKLQSIVEERRRSFPGGLSQLRAGLHVGEVLVAPSWERAGFSVSGDVVNVARRLCDAAEPGEVLVSTELCRLVSVPTWGSPRELALRNRDERVVAVPLVWSDLESSVRARQRPVTTPLVGRSEQLERLRSLGPGESLLVLGQAGVGKSRLVSELLAGASADTVVVRYHCASFDTAEDLAACRSVLRAVPHELRAEVESGVAEASRQRLTELRTGAPPPEDVTTGDYVRAVLEVLDVLSAVRPVLLAFEDVQWARGPVLALVQGIAGSSGATAVLTSREPVPELPVEQLDVPPLGVTESEQLVALILPGPPAQVVDALVGRAGGLPLFLEQGALLLLEQGTVRLTSHGCELVDPAGLRRVPTVMRLFVGARLDNLPEPERHTLAVASVLGDSIDPALLEALSSSASTAVEALLARGYLVWGHDSTSVDRPQLRFAHALVRDVTYESLLRRERARIHCAAADWYAVLPVQEMLKARVQHLLAAVELGPPDCELARQAGAAMTEWAEMIMSERPREALAVLDQLLSLADGQPHCDIDLLRGHLALAHVHEHIGNESASADHARVASVIAAAREDEQAKAQALLAEARALALSDPRSAADLLAAVEGHFVAAGDRAGAARTAIERAIMREGSHGLAELVDAHRDAYRVGVQVADARLAAHASQQLAFLSYTESAEESRLWLQRARHSARADDEVGSATLVLAQAIVETEALELERALSSTAAAREAARAASSDYVTRNALIYGAEARALLGPSDQAEAWLQELETTALRRPNALLDHNARVTRALLHARRGEADAADLELDKARTNAEREGLNYERTYLAMRAQVLCERGAFAEAAAVADRTALLDVELRQPFPSLRVRLLGFRARVGARDRISLSDGLALPREAAERGAPAIRSLARLWIELDESLRGERGTWDRELPPLAEAEALDLEIEALRTRRPERLLDAADIWSRLGTTVWWARALLWSEELTGVAQPRAAVLLEALRAPAGTGDALRAQVRGLLP